MAFEMTDQPRLFAYAIALILSSRTNATVGYLYEWNNGERQAAWLGRPYKRVRYESLDENKAATVGEEIKARSGR